MPEVLKFFVVLFAMTFALLSEAAKPSKSPVFSTSKIQEILLDGDRALITDSHVQQLCTDSGNITVMDLSNCPKWVDSVIT